MVIGDDVVVTVKVGTAGQVKAPEYVKSIEVDEKLFGSKRSAGKRKEEGDIP